MAPTLILHPSLGKLTYEQQLDEIKTSKEILENLLSKNVTHFSFPFGTFSDFNDDTIKICKQLNFEMVAANYPYIVHKHSNVLALPRFLVRDWDTTEFENNLRQFLD